MTEPLLIIIAILVLANIIIALFKKPKFEFQSKFDEIKVEISKFSSSLDRTENSIKDEFQRNRKESTDIAKENRDELGKSFITLKDELSKSLSDLTEKNQKSIDKLTETLEKKLTELTDKNNQNADRAREQLKGNIKEFQDSFDKSVKSFNDLQKEKFDAMAVKQDELVKSTELKLEKMRETVDEKLQKTLNERLSQSFEQVGKQLESVQKGLGEMQTLAQDVGGLKRVLSNVKMRGGIGEVQLAMLLEQVLAPDQYEANVKTKASSNDLIEFAIKLPGKDDSSSQVWLPIDAKFPKDIYEKLQDAYDEGDIVKIEIAQKTFDTTIKKMAKDISDKYIDPPNTTDFGIMFLPFEGIYAEVVRKASLLDDLQRNYKIIVTGPTTLAAILNSLQMGFKTLAIQKRSSEVWRVLGAVKKEFENFGGMLEKAQKNIQTGMNQLDDVMGKRTRAINRKLTGVEALSEADAKLIIPEIAANEYIDDDVE